MADPPAETTDPALPRFDLSRAPEGFDLSTPAFGLTPAAFGAVPSADFRAALPAFEAPPPDLGPSDPGPRDPGPSDPGPRDPGPSDPGPSDPGPSDPGPPDPGPSDPGPPDPGSAEPETELPTRQSVDFAAAPVPTDHAHLLPGHDAARSGPAADPDFIWNLAATDVFPAAIPGSGPPPVKADTRPDPVLRPGVIPPGALPPDDPSDDPPDAGGS